MMKKSSWLLILVVLIGVIDVYAGNLFLNCETNVLKNDEEVVCDILSSSFSKISFTYESNLNVSISEVDGFTMEDKNVITITNQDTIIDDKATIAKLTVSFKDKNTTNPKVTLKEIFFDDELRSDDVIVNFEIEEENTDDCFLESITIDGVLIDGFQKDKYLYENLYVEKQVIFINVVRGSEQMTVTGAGGVFVREGGGKVTRVLHVALPNGQSKDYTLILEYGKKPLPDVVAPVLNKSDNNKLSNIELYNGNEKLDFTFDKEKTSFHYTLPDMNISRVVVNATLDDEKASFVAEHGPRTINLDYGLNKFEIKIQAENGEVRTYIMKVLREDVRDANNMLSKLTVNDVEILLQKDITDYEVMLDSDVTKTRIEAIPTSKTAKVEYQDIDISETEENTVVITVTAESGAVRKYQVIVKRKQETVQEPEITIMVTGYNLNFDANIFDYQLNLKENDSKLDIIINPNSHYQIVGNEDLKDGSVVTIKLDNGKIYKIHLHQNKKETPEEKNNDAMYCYIVFGIGVVAFTSAIIYSLKKRK